MKSLVFIISAYLLLLAMLPCHCNQQDVDASNYKAIEILTEHGGSDSSPDLCTPFCACSSIHNPNFIVRNNFNFLNLDFHPSKIFSNYNENQLSSYLDSLWRPPQI